MAFVSGSMFLWSKVSFRARAQKIFASTSSGYFLASASIAFA